MLSVLWTTYMVCVRKRRKGTSQPSWECKFYECNGVNEVNCCECNCVNQVNFYERNCINQVVYEKEQKGPVSTLAHINGFLLTAIGQKVSWGGGGGGLLVSQCLSVCPSFV